MVQVLGAVKPEALDRLDPDGTMDAYADMTGVPASVLVDVAKAEAIRRARAQAQAQQAAMQHAMTVVLGGLRKKNGGGRSAGFGMPISWKWST